MGIRMHVQYAKYLLDGMVDELELIARGVRLNPAITVDAVSNRDGVIGAKHSQLPNAECCGGRPPSKSDPK